MNPLEEVRANTMLVYHRENKIDREYYIALLQLTLAGLKRFKFKLPVDQALPHQGDWSSKDGDKITLVEDEHGVIRAEWFVYDHSGATKGKTYKAPLFDMPAELLARTFRLLYFKHMALSSEMLRRLGTSAAGHRVPSTPTEKPANAMATCWRSPNRAHQPYLQPLLHLRPRTSHRHPSRERRRPSPPALERLHPRAQRGRGSPRLG